MQINNFLVLLPWTWYWIISRVVSDLRCHCTHVILQWSTYSPLRKAKIRKAFQHFDKDRKGYVSNEEAEQILQGMLGFSHERCKKAIETLDKNQDGKIDYEEFLGFYSMLEEEWVDMCDHVMKWKCFPHHWLVVRGMQDSPHKRTVGVLCCQLSKPLSQHSSCRQFETLTWLSLWCI